MAKKNETETSVISRLKEALSWKADRDSAEYKEQRERKVTELVACLNEMSAEEIREALGGRTFVHAVSNQKGGVSKTTTVSDLLYVLSQKGFKCLAIDMDSQASLSQLLHVFPEGYGDDEEYACENEYGIQDIFDYIIEQDENSCAIEWEDIAPVIRRPKWEKLCRVPVTEMVEDSNHPGQKIKRTRYEIQAVEQDFGFDLISSDISLANYEQLIPMQTATDIGILLLYKVIELIKANCDYDFILIDTPPALTNLTYASIAAAIDGIIVPVSLEVMTLRGTAFVAKAVGTMQRNISARYPEIIHKGILGLAKTQYVKNLVVHQNLDAVVKEFSPIPSFNTVIPRMASCDKAHIEGKLFSQYDKKAYAAFDALATEILAEDLMRKDEKEVEIIETIGDEVLKMLKARKEDK